MNLNLALCLNAPPSMAADVQGSPASSGNDTTLPPAPSLIFPGTRTTCSLPRGLRLLDERGYLPSVRSEFAKMTGGGRRFYVNSRWTNPNLA